MTWVRRADAYPFFDNAGLPLAMAHRGGAGTEANLGLENSMAAFAAAVRLGFGYVETDVHATSDGVLLAFHDRSLERTTDLTGLISTLSYRQVQRAVIGGREPIPRFEDVLTTWPALRLNVDCKSSQAVEPLVRAIHDHGAEERVCVASFSARRLHRLRGRLGPRVATSYAAPGVAALRLLPSYPLRRLAAGRGAVAAQVPVRAGRVQIVTRAFVRRAHALGKHVHVWTVDDPGEMHRLLDLGVDGIISDRPDVLKDVFVARGVWPS